MDPHQHLDAQPVANHPELLAVPVANAIHLLPGARVFAIDPDLADTAAMCDAYGLPLSTSANCVLVTGKRAGQERYVACIALADTRVDVNNVVRRRLEVRKASFASMEFAVATSGMAYGGITPVGLPEGWPIWIDAAVAATPEVVIGAGIRGAKLLVPGSELVQLPQAEVVDGLARPAQ